LNNSRKANRVWCLCRIVAGA